MAEARRADWDWLTPRSANSHDADVLTQTVSTAHRIKGTIDEEIEVFDTILEFSFVA